jgi:aspartyl-tRNA(Asn)/glutamyl-tRNA(Gln) amidotransferase subunit B
LLVDDQDVASYFEQTVNAADGLPPRTVAIWIIGEVFAWMKQSGETIQQIRVVPTELAALLEMTGRGEINLNTAKSVLGEMLSSGSSAVRIVKAKGFKQISDTDTIAALVQGVLQANPVELGNYLAGKETLSNWFFGQVMRAAAGQANPKVLRGELERQLQELKNK